MSETEIVAKVVLPGSSRGELLKLDRPISFWGGIDPRSGRVVDPRHPQYGQSIAGKILAMERSIGSSSGSSVLLELMSIGKGPTAIILTELDAIVTLGVIVGREMGYAAPPVFQLARLDMERLPMELTLFEDGRITPTNDLSTHEIA